MKKLMKAAAALALVLCAGCSTQQSAQEPVEEPVEEEAVTVRVGSLKGPTSLGLLNMMDHAEKNETEGTYEFTILTAADEMAANVVQGNVDIALVPANLASVLYKKTEGKVTVIDINTLGVLYAVAYTLKMSYKTDHRIEGFYEYVVPPLEGFWWQEGVQGVDYSDKAGFRWISVIRLPDFVTEADFRWAVETAAKKKKLDCSAAEFLTIDEGLCVQIMHIGPYDDEPATVAVMDRYLQENGYVNDLSDTRLHHEIYLSDARKVEPAKRKTVIRHQTRNAK